MDYDIERKKQEEGELRKAFREIFPLAYEHDLPWAPCHIKGFLRDLISQEAADRAMYLQQRVARILCEISPPKTHIEDMCRIVVEEAKRGRSDRLKLDKAVETTTERDEMLQRLTEIGQLVGCNHVNDPDGRAKLVQCVENTLTMDGYTREIVVGLVAERRALAIKLGWTPPVEGEDDNWYREDHGPVSTEDLFQFLIEDVPQFVEPSPSQPRQEN